MRRSERRQASLQAGYGSDAPGLPALDVDTRNDAHRHHRMVRSGPALLVRVDCSGKPKRHGETVHVGRASNDDRTGARLLGRRGRDALIFRQRHTCERRGASALS
ncbi:MAG: hypothetical protein ACHREM_10490 [Polyangiales bacterium]